ncbi:MAG: VCBS repeat-containing protein [Proteobacteria bacterium]|nr:VCBS repeat-containing protein [Pseudomonadota bacterium]
MRKSAWSAAGLLLGLTGTLQAATQWSTQDYDLYAGDFNGDGRADLFLQAADAKGLNAVLLSDENGQFTAKSPDQSWQDGYAGFDWAVSESNVLSGDFNGDKKADLLVQAKPLAGTGPGTKTAAEFTPNSNGVVLSAGSPAMFATEGVQAWSRDGFKAEWSSLLTAALVGDFDGDGRSDVILQGLTAGDASYALYGNASGAIFVNRGALGANTIPSASDYRLLAGKFDAQKSFSLYLQAQSASGTNSIQRLSSTALKSVVTDSALAVDVPATPLPANSVTPGAAAAAALAVTSAGRTPGQFSVSALGGAMYTIPIWTPPGARGIEPKLSLVYTSGGQDGPLGPGWALAGLSSISRCNKIYADNAGAPAPVTLTAGDEFCLDGNRLRVTSGTPGYLGGSRPDVKGKWVEDIFGGRQGQSPARFLWWHYKLGEGSWEEDLVESFAGVHDFLDTVHYTDTGLNKYWGWLGEGVFGVYSGAALVPATAIVGAADAPYLASIWDNRS